MTIRDVQVVITRETRAVTQAGFGLPLIVDTDGAVAYALCQSLDDVVAAGFDSATEVYKIVAKLFAQSPRPPAVAVAGVETTVAQAEVVLTSDGGGIVTITATPGGVYDGLAGNGWIARVVNEGDAGLAVSLNPLAKWIVINLGGSTASDDEIAAAFAGVTGWGAISASAGDFTVLADTGLEAVTEDGAGGVGAALSELTQTRNDWYFLLCPDQDAATVDELAAWAAANRKLYFVSMTKAGFDALSPETLEYDRAVVLVHQNAATEYPAEAWVGRCAPQPAGSITWKFKTLSGVTASGYTVDQVTSITGSGGNVIVSQGGILHTTDGTTLHGDFIDIIRCQDYLEASIQESVFRLLTTATKIPYTDAGIAQVVSAIETVMMQAVSHGIIATSSGVPLYTIEYPTREDIPVESRANRTLPDIYFVVILAGAVHRVEIAGVLQV